MSMNQKQIKAGSSQIVECKVSNNILLFQILTRAICGGLGFTSKCVQCKFKIAFVTIICHLVNMLDVGIG